MTAASSTSSTLVVDGLGRRFGTHEAVSSLSFTVEAGEQVGLLGPNGSGKTTTLHMLVGLLEPSAGTIRILGDPPSDPVIRRRVGVAPDDLALPGTLTGAEYLGLHAELRGGGPDAMAETLIELLVLGRHLHRPLGDYSHGMKRKLQLIAAVSHRPILVILDEPHRGLDPEASAILSNLLTLLRQAGTAVLVATHDLLRAERDCDRVVILHEGRTVAEGRPADLCRQAGKPDLEAAFLRLTGLEDSMAASTTRLAEAAGIQLNART